MKTVLVAVSPSSAMVRRSSSHLQVSGQARDVEGRMLDVVDDEVEAAVRGMPDGGLAVAPDAQVIDELAEDRLVRVEQRQHVVDRNLLAQHRGGSKGACGEHDKGGASRVCVIA